jgi:hypothetical protein
VKSFVEGNDINFKIIFLDNLQNFAEKIGIENTNNLIIPALSKIVKYIYINNFI